MQHGKGTTNELINTLQAEEKKRLSEQLPAEHIVARLHKSINDPKLPFMQRQTCNYMLLSLLASIQIKQGDQTKPLCEFAHEVSPEIPADLSVFIKTVSGLMPQVSDSHDTAYFIAKYKAAFQKLGSKTFIAWFDELAPALDSDDMLAQQLNDKLCQLWQEYQQFNAQQHAYRVTMPTGQYAQLLRDITSNNIKGSGPFQALIADFTRDVSLADTKTVNRPPCEIFIEILTFTGSIDEVQTKAYLDNPTSQIDLMILMYLQHRGVFIERTQTITTAEYIQHLSDAYKQTLGCFPATHEAANKYLGELINSLTELQKKSAELQSSELRDIIEKFKATPNPANPLAIFMLHDGGQGISQGVLAICNELVPPATTSLKIPAEFSLAQPTTQTLLKVNPEAINPQYQSYIRYTFDKDQKKIYVIDLQHIDPRQRFQARWATVQSDQTPPHQGHSYQRTASEFEIHIPLALSGVAIVDTLYVGNPVVVSGFFDQSLQPRVQDDDHFIPNSHDRTRMCNAHMVIRLNEQQQVTSTSMTIERRVPDHWCPFATPAIMQNISSSAIATPPPATTPKGPRPPAGKPPASAQRNLTPAQQSSTSPEAVAASTPPGFRATPNNSNS